MSKPKAHVRFTGQHFTINKQLITDLITLAHLLPDDTVIDIGAGKGHLTKHLSLVCRKVIAIEKDRTLVRILEKRFLKNESVDVVKIDFRNFVFPTKPYKVVSNIPFSITSDILRTLMFQQSELFNGGTIITQLEAAEKLILGELYNPYSILYHAYYDIRLIRKVSPDCFMPPPTVMSALLHISKRNEPKISISLRKKYLSFLFYLLRKPDIPARTALKTLFRKSQVKSFVVRHGIDPDSNITLLSPADWLNCFREMLDKVPEKYHPV